MLTVHILPPTHELIANREEAIAAEGANIEQVLVIIDRGLVTAIHTPPVRGHRFESDGSWIRTAISSAYQAGVEVGSTAGQDKLVPPAGWTLWSELAGGDIASSGGSNGWVAISNSPTFMFSNEGRNACRFARADPEGDVAPDSKVPFTFNPDRHHSWPFYRVARRGLTGEQILAVLEAVNDAPADEEVQTTIDRVLPPTMVGA